MSVLDKITNAALMEFAANLNVMNIGTAGDRLFPNIRTEYPEVEYMRLANSPSLPHAAMIHGFDTEAVIGRREPLALVKVEQFLIKEKLCLTETARRYLSRGVRENAVLEYVYDDIGNLITAVRTRAEVAKFETLCTGKMLIAENNVNLEVDYGVPDSNRYNLNWFATDHDIIGDIQNIVKAGKAKGQRYNRAMVSDTVMTLLQQNIGIQKAVNGNINAGILVTEDGVSALFNRLFGFTVETNSDFYSYTTDNGTEKSARLFDEYKMVLYTADSAGAVGRGIWGPSPEESEAVGYDASGYNGMIFVSQWRNEDPAQRWTKASGVFIPVLPNPDGHVIINIDNGTSVLKKLDVTTTPGTTGTNYSKVSVYPAADAGNSFYYAVGVDPIDVTVGETLTISEWTSLTNNTEIQVTNKKAQIITVLEVKATTVSDTTTYTVVGAGYSQINKK